MNPEYTSDGVHLKDKYKYLWLDILEKYIHWSTERLFFWPTGASDKDESHLTPIYNHYMGPGVIVCLYQKAFQWKSCFYVWMWVAFTGRMMRLFSFLYVWFSVRALINFSSSVLIRRISLVSPSHQQREYSTKSFALRSHESETITLPLCFHSLFAYFSLHWFHSNK